jgi:hypothetical protein
MARLTSTGIRFALADTIDSKYWMYPQSTKKLFYQASAPTGWTQDTTHNNKKLRVVSGSGGGSGGSVSFTSAFPNTAKSISVPISGNFALTSAVTGSTTLTSGQIPEHTHNTLIGGTGGSGANPFSNAGTFVISGSTATGNMIESLGGGSHDHPFSGNVVISTSADTTLDLRVQYIDSIICTFN